MHRRSGVISLEFAELPLAGEHPQGVVHTEAERIRELKEKCEKQGLNFEEEERKYREAQEKRKNSFIGKLLG